MKIIKAEHSGTCFGVKKAIEIAFDNAEQKPNLYILGELVHNPYIANKLLSKGVQVIDDYKTLKEGDNLIIRAHGEPKEVFWYCKKNNINTIDCTCPFVKRTQVIASQLQYEGYKVILVGDSNHPEVKGIATHTIDPIIVSNTDELNQDTLSNHKKIGVLSQTTQRKETFENIVKNIVSNSRETKVFNTICNATTNRQTAAIKLCDDVNMMIVIGGKNSANTKQLNEICKKKVKTHWITKAEELRDEWFKGVDTIGITAGASTPESTIKEVVDTLKRINHRT